MVHIYGFFKSLKKMIRIGEIQLHKYVAECVVRVKKEPLNYL